MSTANTLPSYQEGLKNLRSNLADMLPAKSLEVFDKDAEALSNQFTDILQVNIGDHAPLFTLTNAIGENISLEERLKTGRVVLVFYRGTWCPYCNLSLNQYQQSLQEIEKAGASLMAISPQTPDESLTIKEKNALKFDVLSDNSNLVAQQYTKVFRYGDTPFREMKNLGFDFESYYSDDSHEIPVPAVFIIEQDGRISWAKSEGGDYRNRTEMTTLIQQLKKQ